MALNFISTEKASVGNGVKILVYSIGGYGKTLLSATMPDPFLISNESGLLSLSRKNIERTFGVNTPGISYNIPGIEITNYADLLEAYRFITESDHAKGLNPCFDSISEIADICLKFNKANCKDPRQAYGQMNDQITELIRKFRDLPKRHVYFTAKLDKDTDEATGFKLYGPSMPGKQLSQGIDYFFDEMFHLGIGELADKRKFRFLRTQPDNQYRAKDRSGALDEFEKPDLGYIINKIVSKN